MQCAIWAAQVGVLQALANSLQPDKKFPARREFAGQLRRNQSLFSSKNRQIDPKM